MVVATAGATRITPVSGLIFGNPYRAQNLITYQTDTYLHTSSEETLFWFAARAKASGILGAVVFHSHWEWTKQCHLFLATPQQLGLNEPAMMPQHPWDEIHLKKIGRSIEEVNQSLFDFLDRSALLETIDKKPRLLNSFTASWEYVNSSFSEGWYPRQNMRLQGFRVFQGDVFTLVCFHSPRDSKFVGGDIPMHDGFGGYFIREDGKSSFDYAKGAQDPSWTWYSGLGGHSVASIFEHGGAPFGPASSTPNR